MLSTPQQQPYQSTGAPQQYLLATFALFSFFNSPLTSSSSYSRRHDHHHRAGVVLNPHPPLVYAPEIIAGLTAEHYIPHLGGTNGAGNWAFNEYAQVFQLAVSVLVLFSMIMSWFKVGSRRGESSASWLSSVLRIRSKVLGSSSDGHKSLDWLDIGEEIVLKGKNRLFLYVSCGTDLLFV